MILGVEHLKLQYIVVEICHVASVNHIAADVVGVPRPCCEVASEVQMLVSESRRSCRCGIVALNFYVQSTVLVD